LRRRKVLRPAMDGITKPAIRRLARRAGVKRISNEMYGETREALREFLAGVIGDATCYTAHAHRKTVTAIDIIHSLKKRGRVIYGFGG